MSGTESMLEFAYAVEVIGFNQTERIVLSTIFRLSARRTPRFNQHTSPTRQPDLYVVDASDPTAIASFRERSAARLSPVVLIGDSDHGLGVPVLARPLQWTKLFTALEACVARINANDRTRPTAVAAPPASGVPATATHQPPVMANASAAPMKVTPIRPAIDFSPSVANTLSAAPPPTHNSAPAHSAAPPVVTRHFRPTAPPAAATNALALDSVLVVDDNHTVREFMKSKLIPFGFNIDYAETGEQAVGLTGQKHYTCVFLDVIMPGIDGYQVCKLIKAKKQARKTAVVMLTSKGSPFDKIRGAMAGCDSYLTKPVDEDKLLETIAKYLPQPV